MFKDWSKEDKERLLKLVVSSASDIEDVTVHGSYVYGTQRPTSDIDVILWVKGQKQTFESVEQPMFDDIQVHLFKRRIEERHMILKRNTHGDFYNLPHYSLMKDEYFEGSAKDLEEFLTMQKARKNTRN